MTEDLGGDSAGLAALLGQGEGGVVGVLWFDRALSTYAVRQGERRFGERTEGLERRVARTGGAAERMTMALQRREAVAEARLVVPGRGVLQQQ